MNRLKAITESGSFKVFLLIVLILLFLIPTSMIKGIIHERRDRSAEAEFEIMNSWGNEFILMGPVIRVPCEETEELKTRTSRGEETEIRRTEFFLWITPKELSGITEMETEIKKRGIFSVPLFSGTVHISGKFESAQIEKELAANQKAFPERAELVIALASQRGICGVEKASWNESELAFLPGGKDFGGDDRRVQGGINAPSAIVQGSNTFDITLAVQGGKLISMVPLGENSDFSIKADWPSPSFQGAYLPLSHTITETSFDAHWEISHLSRNIPLAWKEFPNREGEAWNAFSSSFGVRFFKSLDHYDINIRAVKYALLFIIIPFLAFFLFEIFLRLSIHPVQYLLAGLGNVVFYLLLLSFSEHLSFQTAYLISASAVIIMMSLYSRSLLRSWSKSWIMGFIMILCYAYLYFTLRSEDWALLTGSIGAFAIVALVMFLTRKFDWKTKTVETEEAAPSDVL